MIVRQLEDRLDVAVPPEAHELDGFRNWVESPDYPEQGRISLIQGEVLIDMSPEDIDDHNQVKGEINNVIGPLVKHLRLGRYYPDGALITNDAAGLANEPDAAFASRETLKSGRLVKVTKKAGSRRSIELRGTPDWVLEIVSPSSVRKDTKLLFESYYVAGVQEYWLIDARNDPLQFTIFTRGNPGYEPVAPQDGWRTSSVFNRQFRLEREDDEFGDWLYTLHMREVPVK